MHLNCHPISVYIYSAWKLYATLKGWDEANNTIVQIETLSIHASGHE